MKAAGLALVAMLATVTQAVPAEKQNGTEASASVPSDPHSTTAAYGDWILACRKGAASSRLCEVVQTIQVQGQPAPIARIALFREGKPQIARVTVVLPPNILFASAPRLGVGDLDTNAVNLAWVRCLPGGCFADAVVGQEVLAKWRSLSERGRLDFKDGAGRAVALPFSFRGLGPAYDAIADK